MPLPHQLVAQLYDLSFIFGSQRNIVQQCTTATQGSIKQKSVNHTHCMQQTPSRIFNSCPGRVNGSKYQIQNLPRTLVFPQTTLIHSSDISKRGSVVLDLHIQEMVLNLKTGEIVKRQLGYKQGGSMPCSLWRRITLPGAVGM